MDQRRDVSNVVTSSCFQAISNQRKRANAAPGFIYCAAVNVRDSDPKFEHDLNALELRDTAPCNKGPKFPFGEGWYTEPLMWLISQGNLPLFSSELCAVS